MDIWDSVDEAADDDFNTLKRKVDLVAAGLELGLDFEEKGGGRWTAPCPWHDDHDPSLDVYINGEGIQRFNCAPCGIDGDLFDLVERVQETTTGEALKWIKDHREVLPEPPEPTPKQVLDFREDLANYSDPSLLMQLFYQHRDEADTLDLSWIAEEFGVLGMEHSAGLAIPHFGPKVMDEPVNAVRLRYEDSNWEPKSKTHSTYAHLYGVHRLTSKHKRVLLVEGESDTWAAAYWLRDHEDWAVLGLPTGAGSMRPDWVERLKAFDVVTTMLDGDTAGRVATHKWVEVMIGQSDFVGEIRVAPVPEGSDICDIGPERVLRATVGGESRQMNRYRNTAINRATDRSGYVHVTTNAEGEPKVKPLTDFVLDITEALIPEDGSMTMRVKVSKTGRTKTLQTKHFASKGAMVQWAADAGGAFLGTGNDAAELGNYLMDRSVFAPSYRAVSQVGLHGKAFVLGQRTIGEQSYRWVPPTRPVMKVQRLGGSQPPPRIAFDPNAILALLNAQPLDVSTVVVGWFAAAFARSEFSEFPILNVWGSRGSGKTTYLRTVGEVFNFHVWGGSLSHGITEHVLKGLASCSCGVPVILDEFHADMNREVRKVLDAMWRNAWDGQPMSSGGKQEDPMEIHEDPVTSPLVISGEEIVKDKAAQERSVLVGINRDRRGSVHPLDIGGYEGFGEWWAQQIVEQADSDSVHFGPIPRSRGERSEHGIDVARWGYEGLARVLRHQYHVNLPEFDSSRSQTRAAAVMASDPVLQGLREKLNTVWRGEKLVFTQPEATPDDHVYVRGDAVLDWAHQRNQRWPTSEVEGLERLLAEHYSLDTLHMPPYGRVIRLLNAKDDFLTGVDDNG